MRPDQLDLFFNEDEERENVSSPSGIIPHRSNPPGLIIGTCAWNHAHWRGHFYPEKLSPKKELSFYSNFFNGVEVDASFYRVPAASTVHQWLDNTPENFRFALKAPKSLTHGAYLGLDDRAARAEWDALLSILPIFRGRLASLLIQLGRHATSTLKNRLSHVLSTIPPTVPAAVEFRHRTWDTAEIDDLLRARGVVRVWSDSYLDASRNDRDYFTATGNFRYIRLLGDVSTKYGPDGALNFKYGSVLFERDSDMAQWADRIVENISFGVPVQVFANNHYQGYSPVTVQLLREAVEQRLNKRS